MNRDSINLRFIMINSFYNAGFHAHDNFHYVYCFNLLVFNVRINVKVLSFQDSFRR